MKIDFIIPTYGMKGNDLTLACVKTIRKHMGNDNKIIIIVDGNDHNVCIDLDYRLREFVNTFGFSKKDECNGFAKTCNLGMSYSDADVMVLINNDVLFFEDVRPAIIESFNHDDQIGIVGARLYYPNGTIQHGGMVRVDKHVFYHDDWHKDSESAYSSNLKKYIIGVTGAFFCISRNCYESIGELSTEYFNGFEDTEYCLRAWSKNFEVFYNPDIRAMHIEGATRGKNDIEKQSIDPGNFKKEKESERKFIKYFESVDIHEIERTIDSLNAPFKSKWMEYYNEEGIDLGIRRSGAIGDCVLVTGIIDYIAKNYPYIEIHVLTGCPKVFKGNPNIRRVTSDPVTFRCDVLIDLDMEYEKYPNVSIAESYFNKIFGSKTNTLPILYSDELVNYPIIPNDGEKIFALHMAVSWPSRTLNIGRWNEVIKHILSLGHQILILGTDNDMGSMIDDDQIKDLRGQTTIMECHQLIKHSDCFISTDSSLFHVASATDTPIIEIFSCVSPHTRISRTINVKAVVPPENVCRYKLSEEKEVVTYHECQFDDERQFECIKSITAESIIKPINYLLENEL